MSARCRCGAYDAGSGADALVSSLTYDSVKPVLTGALYTASESVRAFNAFFGGALATLQSFKVIGETPGYRNLNIAANVVSFVDKPSIPGFISVANSIGVPLAALSPQAAVAAVSTSFGYNLGKDLVQSGYSLAAAVTEGGSDALDLSLVRTADRIDHQVDVAKFFLYQITHVSVDMDTGAIQLPQGPH